MAYNSRNLNILTYVNKAAVWYYNSMDDKLTVNYFSDGDDRISQGDLINADMSDGLYILEVYKKPEDDTLKVRPIKFIG